MPEPTQTVLAELKIPAGDEFISLAKRVATSLGVKLGFGLDEIDELAIAVAQACSGSIESAEQMWGTGATLRLSYSSTRGGIAVEVEALAPTSGEALPLPRRQPVRRPSAAEETERALAEAMIRLFVDELRHQVDASRRQIRYRMVKYLVS
jgi:anti-sigma regulatory factor (Ser/Thr protein kinase)